MPKTEITEEQKQDLMNFYKTFDLTKVKDITNLQNQILYQLYKTPREADTQPKFDIYPKDYIHQADILFLPSDAGFKYGLTVVDIGNRLTDCIPLKNKTSLAVARALETIYNKPNETRILNKPQRLEVDSGTEFKGAFKKYCDENKINIRYAEPHRSRQQAYAESRNGAIAKPLLRRMLAEELLTNKVNRKWVDFLPKVLEFLNERYKLTDSEIKALQKDNKDFIKLDDFNAELIENGTKVRYLLDKPIDYVSGKKLTGGFRQGDVRFSKPTVVEAIKLVPNNPPLYQVKGRRNYYTKDQLQIIDDEILPPNSIRIVSANQRNKK